ncbi:MAG TPA: geranylgeranylglycerol-phosphate geranylgeranyltransferase [Bacteroidales bacterium]|nr:geranylgeranylglycerol-phosphate geranylgeranyltransferase [Bacteroidales bacterium]
MLSPGSLKDFFVLIRWRNLVMVALTMILIRYAVLQPLVSKIGVILRSDPTQELAMRLQFPLYDFILLVLATVLITAGGYVINDYFDIKTDLINRGKVIVGTKIPRRTAMMWHLILNAIGIAIGFYISWRARYFMMGALFLIVSGLLYFYSASYKRQFLVGNLIVAVLTAAVPMLVAIYEWPALYQFYAANAIAEPDIEFVLYWPGAFAVFAFLTTLTREIIKDIEDFEGDIAYGRNTVPVVLGINTSKIVAAALIIITIALLFLVWFFYVQDLITLTYISATVIIPMLFVLFRLKRSSSRENLHSASNLMKIVMLAGILYTVVVKVILTYDLY